MHRQIDAISVIYHSPDIHKMHREGRTCQKWFSFGIRMALRGRRCRSRSHVIVRSERSSPSSSRPSVPHQNAHKFPLKFLLFYLFASFVFSHCSRFSILNPIFFFVSH